MEFTTSTQMYSAGDGTIGLVAMAPIEIDYGRQIA